MSARRRYAPASAALVLLFGASAAPADPPAGSAARADPPAKSAAAPVVQVMIAGRGGAVLSGPRTLSASQGTLRVGSRTCAVAAGTPLAALAALRHAGGPAFALRDYGHCGASPANSAELFVYQLAGERNSGQDGWEYKVGNVAGSAGAADPAGPRGDGRLLRSGQRVLWFWCHSSAGGCERTLALSAAGTARRRGVVQVSVTAYDDEGRGAPVARAVVTLGTDFATTARNGRATLIAPPGPGRYQLRASRAGLVPAFPQTIAVK
jgi:hypothetical protein